ncbi:MAG: DHH family phosphoesterase [Patescibacteria group bacterium]|nr:DHH family phosphoesterase [Patescibacteria group bacterium]
MRTTAQKIHEHLKTAQKVVIVPHPNPDEDALGSAATMAEYLASHGRDTTIFCLTPISARIKFLPNIPAITNDPAIFSDRHLDTILFLDCGDPRYAGVAEQVKNHPATIINIDHHATNENYGHYNMVMPKASATAEVLYLFFEYNHLPISRHMATNLLAGLITDTGNFTNAGTTPSALIIAGELVRLGANFNLINFHTQKDKSFDLLKLWGAALSRLAKDEATGLVYTYLKRSDYEPLGMNESGGDGLSDFMNNLDGVKMALVLKETADGKIKGSFRTTLDDTDVAALAKQLGGGGHKKAAGFTAEGTVEEVLDRILTLPK